MVPSAIDLDRQCLTGELVEDVEELQLTAVVGGVVLEVERPDMVGMLGLESVSRGGGLTQAAALPGLGRHAKALLRQIRCTRLRFSDQPSVNRWPWARR